MINDSLFVTKVARVLGKTVREAANLLAARAALVRVRPYSHRHIVELDWLLAGTIADMPMYDWTNENVEALRHSLALAYDIGVAAQMGVDV